MKIPIRSLIAAVILAAFSAPLQAQSPAPLTAEQLRVQIATLEQQLVGLREQLRLTQAPATPPTTLASASAAAKLVKHEWAASTNTSPGVASPPPIVPAITALSVPGDPYPAVAKKDEAYWKARMADLTATLAADQTFLAAAVVRERALDKRLHVAADNTDYIRDRILRDDVDGQWQAAVAEVSRLKAAVVNDQRAISTAEEEARRANVPAGWLRP
jgi:hypothetical protein